MAVVPEKKKEVYWADWVICWMVMGDNVIS
jgi:hypothetical protein